MQVEHTHRAGVLEQDSVRLLTDTGVDGRVLTHGSEHEGIELRFEDEATGSTSSISSARPRALPQTDVFIDLANARERDGGDVRFGARHEGP